MFCTSIKDKIHCQTSWCKQGSIAFSPPPNISIVLDFFCGFTWRNAYAFFFPFPSKIVKLQKVQFSVFPFVFHFPCSTALEVYKWCCEIKLNFVGRKKRISKQALLVLPVEQWETDLKWCETEVAKLPGEVQGYNWIKQASWKLKI